MDNVLVLVRHGQSEWNKLNLFTGWKDVPLSEKGEAEAKQAGQLLKAQGFTFDQAFTSHLIRAWKTLLLIMDEMGWDTIGQERDLPTISSKSLNERDYGDLKGLNKDDARKKWGKEQVHIWRRSFDTPPPGGESLKDTADRVLPYYEDHIWPHVKAGKNVIVSAHGNSLRALMMKLDSLSREEVLKLELPTGVPVVYQLNADGSTASKRVLKP